MHVREAIAQRRSLRSLAPFTVAEELIEELATAASLAPSCFNKQPWRYVFVYEKQKLEKLHTALSGGNAWARKGSLVVAIVTRKDLDCIVKNREYYLFDNGTAMGFMLLKATELGLIAHPIAGYDEEKAKRILNIPEEMTLITLVIFGQKAAQTDPELSENQKRSEASRPPRMQPKAFAFHNEYGKHKE